MSILRLQHIAKRFAAWELAPLDLELPPNATLAVLGPSGSGKSTLLRLIAGLERPDQGRIFLEDREITHLPAHHRKMGVMFQDYALFPHLSVAENVAFGLVVRGDDRRSIRRRVASLLADMGLGGMEKRRVWELSGGEQQRVALARALAPQPRVLLLDEPLAALDQGLRRRLVGQLAALLAQAQVPTLIVTHDPTEACRLATHLAILYHGRLLRFGPVDAVLDAPGTIAAATLLGQTTIVQEGPLIARLAQTLPAASAYLVLPDAALTAHAPDLGIALEGKVLGRRLETAHTLVEVYGSTLELFLPPEHRPGEQIRLTLNAARIRPLKEADPNAVLPTPA
ncbi:MAG: transporter related protein [Desulfomicrobiaceae bacterium]|jgi:ABC-type Fe3+/spermidine/putrescine transport system ATPase subunit|nr:transporter related protein [Desulfomicrobiaceae bacterium]